MFLAILHHDPISVPIVSQSISMHFLKHVHVDIIFSGVRKDQCSFVESQNKLYGPGEFVHAKGQWGADHGKGENNAKEEVVVT